MGLLDSFLYNISNQEIERNATIICDEMYKRKNITTELTMLDYHGRELEIEYNGSYWVISIILGHIKSVKILYSISKSAVKDFLTEVSKDYRKHGYDYNGYDADGNQWWDECSSPFEPEYYKVKRY